MGPRLRRCGAMTLRCRPRAGGVPYAAARLCGRASDNRNLGGYGSPPARGRQRLGLCQGRSNTLARSSIADSKLLYLSLSATFSTPALAQDSSPAWLLPLTPTPPIVSLPTLIG